MCAICGVYDPNRGDHHRLLEAMLGAMLHRGPDDEGRLFGGEIALGMRRLSIIDVAGGHQPISNEDGTISVVMNGEIYNYQQLRATLRRKGHTFTTASDTEVIVHLYEELGNDCVSQLSGMFAFALWDAQKHKLLIARDRLGIKPLYYSERHGRLTFASEIKALLEDAELERALDIGGLNEFLSLKYVAAPRTMFVGVCSLPPGNTLTCDAGGIKISKYWDLSFATHRRWSSDSEALEKLDDLLQQAVRSHLMSDVPLGAFLSGGLDSSLVVSLMAEQCTSPVETFAVGFDGDDTSFSELPWAALAARCFGTKHHEVIVRANDFVDHAADIVWHLDQPVGDLSVLANYLVSRCAARDVKVVLTGEGGDELFAGYARYSAERLAPLAGLLPRPTRSVMRAALAHVPGLRRPKLAFWALTQPNELRRFVSWFPLLNDEVKAAVLSTAANAEMDPRAVEQRFATELAHCDADDRLGRMLYVDTKLWLADDLLLRGDRMSMAASLEARVPLLDHELVEFAASLPSHMKIRHLTRKYLLRQIARKRLPREIVTRKKNGFMTPLSNWFRRGARSFVREMLSESRIRSRGLFRAPVVQTLLSEHESGQWDHSNLIWGLLAVELWHEQFVAGGTRNRGSEGRAGSSSWARARTTQ